MTNHPINLSTCVILTDYISQQISKWINIEWRITMVECFVVSVSSSSYLDFTYAIDDLFEFNEYSKWFADFNWTYHAWKWKCMKICQTFVKFYWAKIPVTHWIIIYLLNSNEPAVINVIFSFHLFVCFQLFDIVWKLIKQVK